MRTRIAIFAAAALAMTGILLTCTPAGGSIYMTIENEKQTPASGLNQFLTVLDIVNIPGSVPLPYFVAAGAVFNGKQLDQATNQIGWPVENQAPVPVAPPASGALCQSLALSPNYAVDHSLLGGFFSSDGSIMGLYSTTTTGSGTSGTWNQVTGGGAVSLSGKQIVLMQVANGNLFVVAASAGASNYTYELDYSADPTSASWSQVSGMTGLAAPVTGVAFSGSSYFITVAWTSGSTASLKTTPDLVTLTDATASMGMLGADDLRGVTADPSPGTNVLIPSKLGTVYYSTNSGAGWNHYTTGDQATNGNTGVVGFLTVSQQVGSSGPVYLVGSDGNSFYYLNLGGTGTFASGLSRFSDVTQTGLYAGAVRRILVDYGSGRGNLVFFGMASSGPSYVAGPSEGLWRSSFDPTTGALSGTWVHD